MKVSDPIIFGHAVEAYFKDIFEKYKDEFEKFINNVLKHKKYAKKKRH